jgi:hypothetical protein
VSMFLIFGITLYSILERNAIVLNRLKSWICVLVFYESILWFALRFPKEVFYSEKWTRDTNLNYDLYQYGNKWWWTYKFDKFNFTVLKVLITKHQVFSLQTMTLHIITYKWKLSTLNKWNATAMKYLQGIVTYYIQQQIHQIHSSVEIVTHLINVFVLLLQ